MRTFNDARCTWQCLLKNFATRAELERSLTFSVCEVNAAREFDSVIGLHAEAAADQL